jgi:hypothetical protein
MSSPSTFSALYGGTGRNQIPSQVLSTTTETVFTVNTDNGVGAPAVLSLPTGIPGATGAKVSLYTSGNPALHANSERFYGAPQGTTAQPYHTSGAFNGSPFLVRVFGTFTSGVAANDLQIALYLGSSATIGSDHIISALLTTGTGGDFGAVSGKFCASYRLMWDLTTGKLDGIVDSSFIVPSGVAATVVGGTAVTETSAAALSNVTFVATAKWNAANAGNTVQVTEFSLSDY